MYVRRNFHMKFLVLFIIVMSFIVDMHERNRLACWICSIPSATFFLFLRSMTARRRRLNPKKHACTVISLGIDQHDIIEDRYINKYKGHGVFAKVNIEKGSFILEYRGQQITGKDADSFGERNNTYVYYFKHNGETVCIDATNDDGSFGRLVNDSAHPNSKMKKIVLNGTPHLCLFAIKVIKRDDEITYDYGGDNLTWRTSLCQIPVHKSPATTSRDKLSDPHLQTNDDQTLTSGFVTLHEHPGSDIPPRSRT